MFMRTPTVPKQQFRGLENHTVRAAASLLLLALLAFCGRERVAVLSSDYGEQVFVAEDKETMESLIDLFVSGNRSHASLMGLLAEGRVLCVRAGTKVIVAEDDSFARTKRIRITEGEYEGRDGWVYEIMLDRLKS